MLALFVAHVLSDFSLQPDWMIRAKQRGPHGVLPHIAVVAVMTLLAIAPAFNEWAVAALFIIVTHTIIDIGKISIDQRFPRYTLLLFHLDQLLHLTMIVIATTLVAGRMDASPWPGSPDVWYIVLAYALLTSGLGIVARIHMNHWRFESRWVGALGRGLVLTFALLGWPALALLVPLARILWWRSKRMEAPRAAWIELLAGDGLALVAGIVLRVWVGS